MWLSQKGTWKCDIGLGDLIWIFKIIRSQLWWFWSWK